MATMMTMPINAVREDNLAFLAFPAKHAAEEVSGTMEALFKSISTIISELLGEMISKRSGDHFCAARDGIFDRYVTTMLALGNLVRVHVPGQVVVRLAYESMSEMEADLMEFGASAFGKELTDQALFSVWTLRKINDHAEECRKTELQTDLVADDREMFGRFLTAVLFGRFHLDCLMKSLRNGRPVHPEVLDAISDGLRTIVNAYAYIKQAVNMRRESQSEEPIVIEFDEEEQELLASSMNDIGLHN